jgi:hypothetical protein
MKRLGDVLTVDEWHELIEALLPAIRLMDELKKRHEGIK